MHNRLIRFLEEIGANKLTIDFTKKHIVMCSRCKHAYKKYEDFDDLGVQWYYLCKKQPGVDDIDDIIITGNCLDFEKKPWYSFLMFWRT